MKKNAFITAEYNPLHNGHLYHITQTKNAGAENVIVIMSGNYVQRGECALFPKTERVKAAVDAGADLVLELPLKYAVGGSAYFSYGAVKTAFLTGLDGTLSFGAESDIGKLRLAADFLKSNDVSDQIKEMCKCKGFTFPRARQVIVERELGSEFLDTVSAPNNILALHYIAESLRLNAPFDFFALERIGAPHDGMSFSDPEKGFAGAMQLRKLLTENSTESGLIRPYVPECSFNRIGKCIEDGRYIDHKKFSFAAMSRLLSVKKNDLINVNGISQGLENVFFEAIRRSTTLDEVCAFAKSKRYTMSRLRQCCVGAALGIKKSDLTGDIPFVTVLGFNQKGREILREIDNNSSTPFVGLLSQAKKLGTNALRDVEIIENAEYLYNLCLHKPEKDFSPYKIKPYIK